MRKIGAENGVAWIGQGFRIVQEHPTEFLVMALIYTAIALVPILGGLIMLFLGPVLFGGMIHAAREAAQGRQPRIGHLFQVFQDNERVGSFIALSLPTIALFVALIAAFMPLIMAVFQAIQSGQISPDSQSDAANLAAIHTLVAGMIGTLMPRLLLFLVFALLISMLLFLAPARVLIGRQTAFAAMRTSFSACLRNFGAYFICLLLLGMAVIVARVILSFILPGILVLLLTNVPFIAILGPITYVAHRSIFDEPEPEADSNLSTPPPSSGQHTIEV